MLHPCVGVCVFTYVYGLVRYECAYVHTCVRVVRVCVSQLISDSQSGRTGGRNRERYLSEKGGREGDENQGGVRTGAGCRVGGGSLVSLDNFGFSLAL